MFAGMIRWFRLKLAQHRLSSENQNLRDAALATVQSYNTSASNALLLTSLEQSQYPDICFQSLRTLLDRKQVTFEQIEGKYDQLIGQLSQLDRLHVADAALALDEVKAGWDESDQAQAMLWEFLASGGLPQSLATCLQNRLQPSQLGKFISRLKEIEATRFANVVSILDQVDPAWHLDASAQALLSNLLFDDDTSFEVQQIVKSHLSPEAATSKAVVRLIQADRAEVVCGTVERIKSLGLSLSASSIQEIVPSLTIKPCSAIEPLALLFDQISAGWDSDERAQSMLAASLFSSDTSVKDLNFAGRVQPEAASHAAFDVENNRESYPVVTARLEKLDALGISWRTSRAGWTGAEKMIALGMPDQAAAELIDQLQSDPERAVLHCLLRLTIEKRKFKAWMRCRNLLENRETAHLVSLGNDPTQTASLRETALRAGVERTDLTADEIVAVQSMANDGSEDKYVRAAAMRWAGSLPNSHEVAESARAILAKTVDEPLTSAAVEFLRRSQCVSAFPVLLAAVRSDRLGNFVRNESCKTLIRIDPAQANTELRFMMKDATFSRMWPYLGELLESTGELESNDGPTLSVRSSLSTWRSSVATASVDREFKRLCDGLQVESDLSKIAAMESVRQTALDANIDLIDLLEHYEDQATYRRRNGVKVDPGTIARCWGIGEFWRGPEF